MFYLYNLNRYFKLQFKNQESELHVSFSVGPEKSEKQQKQTQFKENMRVHHAKVSCGFQWQTHTPELVSQLLTGHPLSDTHNPWTWKIQDLSDTPKFPHQTAQGKYHCWLDQSQSAKPNGAAGPGHRKNQVSLKCERQDNANLSSQKQNYFFLFSLYFSSLLTYMVNYWSNSVEVQIYWDYIISNKIPRLYLTVVLVDLHGFQRFFYLTRYHIP